MKKLSDFLVRFEKIIKFDKDLKNTICFIFNKQTNIEFNPQNIEIKNGSVYVKTNSYQKNEIFLKKDIIRSEIKKITGKNLDILFTN